MTIDERVNAVATAPGGLLRQVAAEQFREAVADIKKHLPATMQNCTILFKECVKGHGWLTASNWVDHGCPTCAVAEAVAAEREKHQAVYVRDMQAQKERHAAELKEAIEYEEGRTQHAYAKMAAAEETHAAELAKWKEVTEHHLSDANRLSDDLAASDQRWQERESKMEADWRVSYEQQERAWEERLKRVEANHKKHADALRESGRQISRAAVDQAEQRGNKAVADAYEQAVKILDREAKSSGTPVIHYLLGRLAIEVRQLAAKPQEPHDCPTFPDCECGLPDDSVKALQEAGITWSDVEVKVEAHDAPPAPKKPYVKPEVRELRASGRVFVFDVYGIG